VHKKNGVFAPFLGKKGCFFAKKEKKSPKFFTILRAILKVFSKNFNFFGKNQRFFQ